MENTLAISPCDYRAMILDQIKLNLVKEILFNSNNRLTWDKKELSFEIDEMQVKLLFPEEYEANLKERKKELGNV